MQREAIVEQIVHYLTLLRMKVESFNALNLTDLNIHSEEFFKELLNLVYGYNLINMNIVENNFAAIDLGDEGEGIAIQVTSTSDLRKVRKTVDTFARKRLYEKFDQLKVLNIGAPVGHEKKDISSMCGNVVLCTKNDIWTTNDLLKVIKPLPTERLTSIHLFLQKELGEAAGNAIPKEIETFMRLIELISAEVAQTGDTDYTDEPDPDGKINDRFAGHAAFLKERYVELYKEYGATLATCESRSDIGAVRVRRLGFHLKSESDAILKQNSGDPHRALEALEQRYAHKLSSAGIEHDVSAVRFFLIDQLIKCNVFPNKGAVHV